MPTSHVRLATADDAAAVADLYRPLVRDTAVTFEVDEPSADEMRRRIVGTAMRFPWVVADDGGGTIAGFAYAGRHRRHAAYACSADVSVYVAPATRRAGVARGLYRALLDLLTAQGYACAVAGIALPNDASVRLHEAVGFTLVGVAESAGYKLGDWWDVAWWQRRLPVAAGPSAPAAIVEIDGECVAAALAAGDALVAAAPEATW